MKILMTGLNGTVAPIFAEQLTKCGHDVVAWDRSCVPIDNPAAMQSLFDRERPVYFFHIATGPAEWAESIAAECANRRIGLLYTSSVSVFSGQGEVPLRHDATPDATDDYGRYKADCEVRIRGVHHEAIIVRLGWQIGIEPGSNNMIDYFHRQVDANKRLEVSRQWYPACSFLTDTAECISKHFTSLQPDTYHLEGNPGLSIYEIAVQLKRLHGWDWTIVPIDQPSSNNLMEDERLSVQAITESFAPSES